LHELSGAHWPLCVAYGPLSEKPGRYSYCMLSFDGSKAELAFAQRPAP
jgi:hypothetical protein